MLHPVLPPAPPSIVEPLQPGNPMLTGSDTRFHSITELEASSQKNQPQRQPDSVSSTPQNATRQDLAVSQTQTAPSQPESFPPEFSPLTTVKSAAALGESMGISYPVLPDANVPSQSKISQKGQILQEKLAPSLRQNNTIAQNATSAEPIQNITYTNTNPDAASTQKVENVIEFKSRSQTSQITIPKPDSPQQPAPTPTDSTNQQQSQPSQTTPPATTTPARERIVEITSDRQEYDQQRRIVTAVGNVVVRFDGAVVDADRLQVNLDNLIAVGDGNVALTRGDQVLRGERFTYNFVQDSGELKNGRGEVYIPSAGSDLAFNSVDTGVGGVVTARPPSDRIRANQPTTGVNSPGGVNFNLGGRADATNLPAPKVGGVVKRVRFQAERVDFYPRGWQARNVRFTNDPFSPPELELRADKVTLTREAPLVDTIKTERQRLVLDQRATLPIPIDRQTIDRRERDVTPAIASIGFDGDQRGGLFIERSFQPFNTEGVRFTVTPQFFAQKAISGGGNFASLFGLTTKLTANLSPKTRIEGSGILTSLDLGTVEDNLRASLRLRQELGDRNPHILNLEYSYRDRLYNGTLGFQTVQSSLGAVVTSPRIPLGKTGFNLRYQGGAQYINANSDRLDLLATQRENNRISLGRVQGSATVDGGIILWQGKGLPPTPTEGLRYTPNPIVPYIQAFGDVTGTSSYYSSGDNQTTLIATAGLRGQFGHFSRRAFDYTAFNVSYSQGLFSGASPFLFDRAVDNKVLNLGISQQLYGPFSLGFQTSINLDTGGRTSTDYIVEYNRRSYGITLRYNPVLELGGISFRISDFNWSGGTDPFSDPSEVKPVRGGVRQDY
jgi:lipopolysaccharide export system protein LptA